MRSAPLGGFAAVLATMIVSGCSGGDGPVATPIDTIPASDAGASTPDATPIPPSDGGVSPDAQATAAVDFKTCSLISGGVDNRAQCATLDVPLDWNEPEGRKIKLFVKRVLGTSAKRRQVWLLQGGPGSSGAGFESLVESVISKNPDLDVYIPDHRGTGGSTFLDCATARQRGLQTVTDITQCAGELRKEWGDKLSGFGTTQAARDVGETIARTREPGQDVHVYGVSYGTYWAQRYLQLFPAQPTSVALDGVCAAGLCSLLTYWHAGNEVGKQFLEACAGDAFCSERLGPDPVAKTRAALDAVDSGACAGTASLSRSRLRSMFATLLRSEQLRTVVPAVVHRILRCSPEDVTALQHFANLSLWSGAGGRGPEDRARSHSEVLLFQIAFSELEESPPRTVEQLRAMDEDIVFGSVSEAMREAYDAWPRYPHDEYVGKFPETSVPVLLLNGTLDPQTPYAFAEAVAKSFTAPHQRLVALPRVAHGVIFPTSRDDAELTCGMKLWQAFEASPRGSLDTSCVDALPAIDFRGEPALADYFMNTPSIWGVGAPSARKGPWVRLTDKTVRRALERASFPMPVPDLSRAARRGAGVRK